MNGFVGTLKSLMQLEASIHGHQISQSLRLNKRTLPQDTETVFYPNSKSTPHEHLCQKTGAQESYNPKYVTSSHFIAKMYILCHFHQAV